ncbi:MAG: DUF5703 family protein [Candidatus Nanopelagicales bacterium]
MKKSHWEIREITFGFRSNIQNTREALTDLAEYGNWELHRTRIYPNGLKRVWVKRRVLKIAPSIFFTDSSRTA